MNAEWREDWTQACDVFDCMVEAVLNAEAIRSLRMKKRQRVCMARKESYRMSMLRANGPVYNRWCYARIHRTPTADKRM